MRKILGAVLVAVFAFFVASPQAEAQSASPPYGIAAKRPLFGGACKACPWGVLAYATAQAMKPYGYEVQICWVCWSNLGPRAMADKTKPVAPSEDVGVDPEYVEPPPDGILDFSATSEVNLISAWNGTAAYAKDNRKRQNYRVIAALQQPNYLLAAASKNSGIKSLSEIKDRKQATWVVVDGNEATNDVLAYYGITEALLKSHGGGFVPRSANRTMRASADLIIHNGLLVNTPEQRVWYEATQLSDLVFLQMDEKLIEQLARLPGYARATVPLSAMRGIDRQIPTVMRSTHFIYVRDEAPDDFAYTVAKALDEQQQVFRMQAEPFYYDPRLVAVSTVIPLHPGALKYYRERGYVK